MRHGVLLLVIMMTTAGGYPLCVQAHAFASRASPPVGATVDTPPARVRIRFSEPVSPAGDALRVLDRAGRTVSQGRAHRVAGHATLLEVALKPLSPGRYHVYWNVTDADGHRTHGDYSFRVR